MLPLKIKNKTGINPLKCFFFFMNKATGINLYKLLEKCMRNFSSADNDIKI